MSMKPTFVLRQIFNSNNWKPKVDSECPLSLSTEISFAILLYLLNQMNTWISPTEDEGARVKGRRLTLSDVNGNGLRWKPFNGTWINGYNLCKRQRHAEIWHHFLFHVLDGELVYRDPFGGLSILAMDTSTVKVLMTNTTFVSWLRILSFFIHKSETNPLIFDRSQQRQLNAEKYIVSPDVKYVLLLADCSLATSRFDFSISPSSL